MPERLTSAARRAVTQAQAEALALGAPTIEAEHLLLALAAGGDDGAAALATYGLTHDRLLELLEQEHQRSLVHAGVDVPASALGRTLPRRKPRLGTSTKAVLVRAVGGATRHRGISSLDLLRATVRAEAGTVPRVLAIAGVSPEDLAA